MALTTCECATAIFHSTGREATERKRTRCAVRQEVPTRGPGRPEGEETATATAELRTAERGRGRMKQELEKTRGQWIFDRCEVMVHMETAITVDISRQCEACGNCNLRFEHILEHEDGGRFICVGIKCARMLLDKLDRHLPRLAENETARKARWRIHYGKPGRCFTTYADLEEKGKV
jgi:hypothetical protein